MTKEVFFLGAGFSKAVEKGYPTLKELGEKIMKQFKESFFEAVFQDVMEKCDNDIERVLTYLSSNLPWIKEDDAAINKALFLQISQKIAEVFSSIETNNLLNENLAKYIVENKENVTVITLNYDLLLENSLIKFIETGSPKEGIPPDFAPFYKFAIGRIENRNNYNVWANTVISDKYPRILKLHGSFNWFYTGVNNVEPIYYDRGGSLSAKSKDIKANLYPYIVPPVLDKNAFYMHNDLKYLWTLAYNEFSQADKIHIIGFSLPMTDLPIRFLFNSSKKKDKKREINIIDINDGEDFKQHYKKAFVGDNVSFDFCCKEALNKFCMVGLNTKK